MSNETTNRAASVKQKLLNLSRSRREDFAYVLERYMLERFLYRLGISEHSQWFILKGAMLFAVWSPLPHRVTRDIDLMSLGQPDPRQLRTIIESVCSVVVEEDGLFFDAESIEVRIIRELHLYDGLRVLMYCYLGKAKTRLQVDVGFGDDVYPRAKKALFPTILKEQKAPRIKVYQMETSISEKLHAMVDLGIRNSRMKDYFDVAFLARHFDFGFAKLVKSVEKTFKRRGTLVPEDAPLGLTEVFFKDPQKVIQWKAFLKKSKLHSDDSLLDIGKVVSEFLLPVIQFAGKKELPILTWNEDTGWT